MKNKNLKASVKEFLRNAEEIYRCNKTYERWTALAAEIIKLNRSLHETERKANVGGKRRKP